MAVPDPPNIQIRPESSLGTLQFWWSPPTNIGGSPITGYTLSCSNPPVSQTYGPTIRYARLTGLINSRTYAFTLTANNSAGSSIPNPFRPVDPGIITNPPSSVTFSKRTDGATFTATANWLPPVDLSGACQIGWYLFSAIPPVGSRVVKAAHGYDRSRSISGLNPAIDYTYLVQAIGNAGYSNPVTLTLPGQPTNLSSVAGNSSARLSWLAPTNTGGLAITNYQYSFNGVTFIPFSPAVTGVTADISGLVNGTQYTVVLQAVTSMGAGPSSASTTFIPTSGGIVPGAPTLQTAIPGSSTVQLNWITPTVGAPITNYQYSINGGTTYTTFIPAVTGVSTDISGLTNGVAYAFRLRAINAAGIGAASGQLTATPNIKPGVPTPISTTPGNTVATVYWSNPTTGLPIIRYQYSINSGLNWSNFNPDVSGSATAGIITGLTNGVTYTILLRSVNSVDNSFASNPIQVTPTSGITVPGTPTNVTAVAGNLTATMSWTVPSTGGSPITRYQYAFTNVDASFNSFNPDVSGSATSGTITGLTNGRTYTVFVRARNSVGAGIAAAAVSVTPNVAPGAPTLLTATPFNGFARLTWTAPTTGAPFTNYQYSINGGSSFIAFSTPVTGTTADISGLINGTLYTVQIKAVNSVGAGAASNSLTVRPNVVPAAPTGLTASPGNGAATISWAPLTVGQPVTRYQYAFTNVDASFNSFDPDVSGAATSGRITGLTNGRTYNVFVRARNAIGAGLAVGSVSVTPTSGATVPGVPTNVSGTPGNNLITMRWTVPSNGGSPITRYQYAFTNVDASFNSFNPDVSGAATSGIITGLTNGRSYNVFVRARNAIGAGAAAAFVVVRPNVAPTAPTIGTATPGNTTATITWTSPTTGAPFTRYQYSINSAAYISFSADVSGAATSGNIAGLTNGTLYTVVVRAVNDISNGAPSGSVTVTPNVAPGAPTLLTATPFNGFARLTWTAPTTGAPFTNYQYSTNGGSSFTAFSTPVTGTTADISGLTNGTLYTVQIKAVNAINPGTASNSLTVRPNVVPGAPTSVSASPGNTIATLNWTVPAVGAPITRYQYAFTNVDASFNSFDPDVSGASTSGRITGLTNGRTYTVFVRARNAIGAGVAAASVSVTPTSAATVPGVPTNVSGTPGNMIATMNWTVPSNGGSPITRYQYAFTNVDASFNSFNPDVSGAATSGIITNLTNGTAYNVFVRARNAIGAGAAAAFVVVRPNVAPTAPTIGTATPGNTTATITWTSPTTGAPFTRYQYSINSGAYISFSADVSGAATSGNIAGLTNGTLYTVVVRAVNDISNGAPSGSVTVRPNVVPGAPTGVSATPGNGTATLNWTVPAVGAPITRYQYAFTNVDASFNSFDPDVSGAATSGTITGLTNGRTYTVFVRARNAIGAGVAAASVSVTPTSGATVPGVPTNVSGTPGNMIATMNWTVPSNGGSPITRYQYAFTNVDASFNSFNPDVSGAATSGIITNLTNGTAYNVFVRARNAIGAGAAAAFVVVRPNVAPTAPTIGTATPGNTTATITWTSPTAGAPFTRYQYSINSGAYISFSADVSGAATSGNITGLTNGTLYTVVVRAVNDISNGAPSGSVTVTPNVAPGAPTLLTATPFNSFARLTWTAPTTGAPFTNYQYSINGGSSFIAFSTPVTGTTADISGLTNGTLYTVQIKAVNAINPGAASNSLTVRPNVVPAAPTTVIASPGNTNATISWDYLAVGQPVTHYQYDLSQSGSFSNFSTDVSGFTTSGLITNLINGRSYVVRVRAQNDIGNGAISNTVSVTPSPAVTAPLQLSGLTSVAGNNTGQLKWSPANDGGSPILYYEYSGNPNNYPYNRFTPDISGSSTTGYINWLPNTTMPFYVRAVNAIGPGPQSNPVSITPSATLPGTPSNLLATPGNASAVIFWTKIDVSGTPITQYQYSLNGGTTFNPFTPDISDGAERGSEPSSGRITGLTNGTTYTVTVRAVSGAIAGDYRPGITVRPFSVVINSINTAQNPPIRNSITTFIADISGTYVYGNDKWTVNGTDVSSNTNNRFSYTFTNSGTYLIGYSLTAQSLGTVSYLQSYYVVAASGDALPLTSSSGNLVNFRTPSNYSQLNLALKGGCGGGGGGNPEGSGANGGGGGGYLELSDNDLPELMFNIVTGAQGLGGVGGTMPYDGNNGGDTVWYVSGLFNLVSLIGGGVGGASDSGGPFGLNVGGPGGIVISIINGTKVNGAAGARYNNGTGGNGGFGGDGISRGGKGGNGYAGGSSNGGNGTAGSFSLTLSKLTAPSKPTGLNSIAGNGSVRVTWSPVNNGGSRITRYEYSMNNSPSYALFNPDVSGTDTSGNITDLTNGNTYTVIVRAVNSLSPGLPSDSIQIVPGTTPSAPTNILYDAYNIASVTIGWTQSDNGGYSITKYQYSMNDGVSYNDFDFDGGASDPVGSITGLITGTPYTLVVAAVNSKGTGAKSASVTFTPYTDPGTPGNLTATPGNTRVTLNWEAPSSDNGAAITTYQYSLNQTEYFAFSPPATGATRTADISGLTNGVSYVIYLAAINNPSGATRGDPAGPVNATPVGAPGIPQGVSATPGNATATISWLSINDGGSPITNYQYAFTNVDASFNNFNPDVSGDADSGNITGLTNGRTYTVYLRARNAIGAGVAAAPVSVTPNASAIPTIRSIISSPQIPVTNSPTLFTADISGSYTATSHLWTVTDTDMSGTGATFNPTFTTDGAILLNYTLTTTAGVATYSQSFYVITASGEQSIFNSQYGYVNLVNYVVPTGYTEALIAIVGGSGGGGGGGGGGGSVIGGRGGGGGGGGYLDGTISITAGMIFNAGILTGGGGGVGGVGDVSGAAGALGNNTTMTFRQGAITKSVIAYGGGGGGGGGGASGSGGGLGGTGGGGFVSPGIEMDGTPGQGGQNGNDGGVGGDDGADKGKGGNGGNGAAVNGVNGEGGTSGVFRIIFRIPPPTPPEILAINSTPVLPVVGVPITFTADISGSYMYVGDSWTFGSSPDMSSNTNGTAVHTFSTPGEVEVSYVLTMPTGAMSFRTTFYVVDNSGDPLVLEWANGPISNFKVPPQYNYFSLQMIGGSGQGGGGGGGDGGQANEYGNGGGGGGGGGYISGTINLPGPNIILNMAEVTSFTPQGAGDGGTNGANGTAGANGSPTTLAITGSQTYTILAGAGGGGQGGLGNAATPGPAAAGGTRGEFTIPVGLSQLTGTRGTAGTDGEAGGTGTGNYGLGGAGGQTGVSFASGGTGGSGGSIEGYNGTNGADGFPQVFNIIISKTATLPPPTIISFISTPSVPIQGESVTFTPEISGTFIYVSQAWSVDGTPTSAYGPLELVVAALSAGKHDISCSLTSLGSSAPVTYTQSIYVVAAQGDAINILSTDGPLYNYRIPDLYTEVTYCLIGGGGGGLPGVPGSSDSGAYGGEGGNGGGTGYMTTIESAVPSSSGQLLTATLGTGGTSSQNGNNTVLRIGGTLINTATGGTAGLGGAGPAVVSPDGGNGGAGTDGISATGTTTLSNPLFGAGGGGGGGGGANRNSGGFGGNGGLGGAGNATYGGAGESGTNGDNMAYGQQDSAAGGPGGRGGNGFYRITLKPPPPTPLEFTSHIEIGGIALPAPYYIPIGYNLMDYVLVGAGGAGTNGGGGGELGGNGGNGGGVTASIADSSTAVVANVSLQVEKGLGAILGPGGTTTLRYNNQDIAYSFGGSVGTGVQGQIVYNGADGGLGGDGSDGMYVKNNTLRVGAGGGGGGGGNGENGSGGTGGQAGQQSIGEGAMAGSNGASQMVGLGGKGGDGFYYIRLSYQAPQ